MDDLALLAEYNPECFAKTCRNLIYNIPEAKQLLSHLKDETPDVKDGEPKEDGFIPLKDLPMIRESQSPEDTCEDENQTARIQAENFLNNLGNLELSPDIVTELDTDKVKELVGNLYMEMLYPHNYKAYDIGFYEDDGDGKKFDMKS